MDFRDLLRTVSCIVMLMFQFRTTTYGRRQPERRDGQHLGDRTLRERRDGQHFGGRTLRERDATREGQHFGGPAFSDGDKRRAQASKDGDLARLRPTAHRDYY